MVISIVHPNRGGSHGIDSETGRCPVVFVPAVPGAVHHAQAQDMKAGPSEGEGGQADQKDMTPQKRVHIIQGNVVRVEYGDYFVKQKNGTDVILRTDNTTQMMGQIKKGDRKETTTPAAPNTCSDGVDLTCPDSGEVAEVRIN